MEATLRYIFYYKNVTWDSVFFLFCKKKLNTDKKTLKFIPHRIQIKYFFFVCKEKQEYNKKTGYKIIKKHEKLYNIYIVHKSYDVISTNPRIDNWIINS